MAEQEVLILESTSPEEALQEAALRLSLPQECLEVEHVDSGKKLFGLFGKKDTYHIRALASRDMLKAWDFLESLAGYMGASVQPQYGEENILEILGEDRELFLGQHGASLRSLEYLMNLTLRDEVEGWIRLDSEGYREIREKGLEESALKAAEEACRKRRPISLDPMTSWERRIVHLALRDEEDVETRSVGEDPSRRVVVWPRKGRRSSPRGKGAFRSRRPRA